MGQVDTSLFTPELVFFDVDASTSDELFETLEPELKAKGYVKDSWLDAIKAREHSYPTGLECQAISVGIPHVEPEHIVKPYIAVIRNTRPIAFAPMGGMVDHDVQAHLVLNLGLLAHAEDQVAVLQALMLVFMDDNACVDILAQTTADDLLATLKKYIDASVE